MREKGEYGHEWKRTAALSEWCAKHSFGLVVLAVIPATILLTILTA